jgi:hypothetical protein
MFFVDSRLQSLLRVSHLRVPSRKPVFPKSMPSAKAEGLIWLENRALRDPGACNAMPATGGSRLEHSQTGNLSVSGLV